VAAAVEGVTDTADMVVEGAVDTLDIVVQDAETALALPAVEAEAMKTVDLPDTRTAREARETVVIVVIVVMTDDAMIGSPGGKGNRPWRLPNDQLNQFTDIDQCRSCAR